MDVKYSNKNIYILIGGGCCSGHIKDRLSNEIENWLTFKQIGIVKVLFIPFAKDEVDWKKTVQKYQDSIFSRFFEKKRILMSIATLDPKTLKKQLYDADVLFFSGGSEFNLKKIFKKNVIPSTNKIIIGVSAGTNFLSKFYFSNDREKIESGLGVLPIKTICHFSAEKNERAILLSIRKKYPLFMIGDDEYVTMIF